MTHKAGAPGDDQPIAVLAQVRDGKLWVAPMGTPDDDDDAWISAERYVYLTAIATDFLGARR